MEYSNITELISQRKPWGCVLEKRMLNELDVVELPFFSFNCVCTATLQYVKCSSHVYIRSRKLESRTRVHSRFVLEHR